ncbi:MAG: hypothetical protein HYS81_00165 [Candidatus Aenigmatarchaeota archaeon]|nr:MAG: hypothetical protein HYS81_00165 [Candidatus Aenigmarchaeota archaeon]
MPVDKNGLMVVNDGDLLRAFGMETGTDLKSAADMIGKRLFDEGPVKYLVIRYHYTKDGIAPRHLGMAHIVGHLQDKGYKNISLMDPENGEEMLLNGMIFWEAMIGRILSKPRGAVA